MDGVRVKKLGIRVSLESKVSIDGAYLDKLKEYDYIVLNKARLSITSHSDNAGRDTIYKTLPEKLSHLNPVGRLDYDASGVLILTNDGELLYKLTHPKFQINRVYRVSCYNRISGHDVLNLKKGVYISKDQLTRPDNVTMQGQYLFITIHEGRYHHVKRMIEAIGNRVNRIKRIEYAGIRVKGIQSGAWRYLSHKEIRSIKRLTS